MQATGRILFVSALIFCSSMASAQAPEFKDTSKEKPFLADDGSLIRSMPNMGHVESVHCSLPPSGIIQASRHKTVEQIWYVTSGNGEMWLKDKDGKETLTLLKKGTGFTVPLGFSFQFRNIGKTDLEIFIVNTTPWSGAGELIPVTNHWKPNFAVLKK